MVRDGEVLRTALLRTVRTQHQTEYVDWLL
jgi:hypothetical protein